MLAFTGKIWGRPRHDQGTARLQDPKSPMWSSGCTSTPACRAAASAIAQGPAMASADELRIKVTGRPGPCRLSLGAPVDPVHGHQPQIVLRAADSRESGRTDLMKSPTVVSVTTINGRGLALQHRTRCRGP